MDLAWNDKHDQSKESERISDLHSYGILDTDPEITFDQLTYIAAKACDAPISLISFIDAERQWFKSTYGLDIHEIPKHVSACNETITRDDIYEIQDAADSKCPYGEFMLEQGFRYYAGVPITSKQGHHMGSLCVIDYIPREIDQDQIHILKVISSQIVDLMELRREYAKNLQELQRVGEDSYNKVGHLQDIAHKASIKSRAELSAGLIYRLRPLAISMLKASDRSREKFNSHKALNIELEVIRQSSEKTLAILNSLERFLTAEKEKWMKPMELSQVIQGVLNHLEYKLNRFNISLVHDLELEVMSIGNVSQISEAIFAVINNAIEAVKDLEKKEIKIELKEKDHTAFICVSDSGKGVPDSIKSFIFQPFFTTKNEEHLGVGLSLAQGLIQKHSGNIKLARSFNPTIFSITLPTP